MFEEEIITTIISGTILLTGLVTLIILTTMNYRNKQAKLLKEIEFNKIQHNNALLQTQIEIQEQTLKIISEEIHDNIGQVLSVVKLNLNTFPPDLPAPVTQKITDTEQLLSKAIDDLRDLSQTLHSDNIAAVGLVAALELEMKQLQKTGRFKTIFTVAGNRFSLEAQKEMVLFRIIQEAINNCIKHSEAKNILIDVLYNPDTLVVQVTDDGKGFDINTHNVINKKGLGLTSMKSRAALIGGDLSVISANGKGTSINITIKP